MANLSQLKREKMLNFLNKIKAEHQDDETLIAIHEIENALTEKKYGLVWEEHTEKVDKKLIDNIPIFTEIKDKKIKNSKNNNYNFLLEGDNLHSLKLLEKTHKGKIDLIYIDPPYNTGNKDFRYDDRYIEKNDGYSHSLWLSFMNERLKIARELLSDKGIIFISIDKNEGFQLKLLLDEIFGEERMVADLHVETSIIGGPRRIPATKGSVVKTTEFIFGYTKGNDSFIMKQPKYDYIPGFDTHYSLYYDEESLQMIPLVNFLKAHEKIVKVFEDLGLKISLKNLGKVLYSSEEIQKWLYSEEISKKIFRKSDEKVELPKELLLGMKPNALIIYENKPYIVEKDGTTKGLFTYSDRIGQADDYSMSFGERSIRGNLWKGFSADGGNLAKEGGVSFKNGKKPLRLIKQLIHSITTKENSDITILDFFAGSGTTGHAVMQLNKEDGGNRKYILCTNNENNICEEVTYSRLENIQDELPHNLKYFRTEFIPKFNNSEENSIKYEMLNHIKELVELEYMCEIDGINNILIKDEEEFDSIVDENLKENMRLFVSSDIFVSSTQKLLIEQKNIELIEIPEYYYRNELREVGEL